MTALLRLFGGWRLYLAVGVLAAVAAAAVYVSLLRADVARLEAANATLTANAQKARAAAAFNARELEAATLRHEAALRDVAAYLGDLAADDIAEAANVSEDLHATDEDDGPIAPVLQRALERLRPPAAGGGNGAPRRAGEGARGVPLVPR